MATDATITSTSYDDYSTAKFVVPLTVLAAGVYLATKGEMTGKRAKGAPSGTDVSNVLLLSSVGLAGVLFYYLSGKKKTPIGTVSGLPPYEGGANPPPVRSIN